MMRQQLVRFAVAGGVGFIVDAAVLYLCLWLGFGYFAGRLVSFLLAVFATWRFNRRYTFQVTGGRSIWNEWWHYLAAMSLGGVVNFGVYSAAILALPKHVWTPLLAVGLGSVVAMSVNFLSAKLWVFRHR
jgi:putative flippase GtrA